MPGRRVSHFDYEASIALLAEEPPFWSLVMAAMVRGDTDNARTLRAAFPDVYDEVCARYNAPGGYLPGELASIANCPDCGHPWVEHDEATDDEMVVPGCNHIDEESDAAISMDGDDDLECQCLRTR